MNTIIQQFDNALAALKRAGIEGLIAGGAVRDYILNKPVRDVDVFVEYRADIEERLEQAFGVDCVSRMVAADYAGNEVKHVFEILGDSLTDVPVQVIVLNEGLTPGDRAAHHDFGICQCWYLGEGKFDWTGAFFSDKELGRFTLSHCEGQGEFDRSMRRWAKFAERFPEFTLRVPEEYMVFHRASEFA